jgi:hypothetical protein
MSIPKTTKFLKIKYPMTNQTLGKFKKISNGRLTSVSCWKKATINAVSKIPRIVAKIDMAPDANKTIAEILITLTKNFIII